MTLPFHPPLDGADDPNGASSRSVMSSEVSGAVSSAGIGRRRFLQGVGATVGAGVVASAVPAGVVSAALPVGASSFRPLPKGVRLVDTRSAARYTFTRVAENRIRLQVAGRPGLGVPADATALVLTVTGINRTEPNFVTVAPTGKPIPTVSNLNLLNPWEINANLVTVKTGSGGSIDVFERVPCDVIVDVLGYYQRESGPVREGRFVGLAQAQRAIDTRPHLVGHDSITVVDVTRWVPAHASSVVINLAATECTAPGFFTAFAFTESAVPGTSSLNVVEVGTTRASAVIVPVSDVGGKRRIKVYALTPAKLIVDVNGYFTGPGSPESADGLFVPVDPVRVLDTRLPGQSGKLWPGWVAESTVRGEAATGAAAIVGNLTAVETRSAGYLTICGARQPIPGTSNVNFIHPNSFVPNHVITPITKGYGFEVFSSHGAHVLFDLAGYYTGKPLPATIPKHQNPPPPPIEPPWLLDVPRLGLVSWVNPGDPDEVTNRGETWHWTGTGYVGQVAHIGLFGHRTEHGGPLRYLHTMQNGDLFHLKTLDGRTYTYQVVRRDLTDSDNYNILAATRYHPGATASLIACTVGYDSSKSAYPDVWAPTSTKYRIVVTGELVGWHIT